MIKKNITLVVYAFGTAIFFVLAFSRELGVCSSYSYSSCADISNNLAETILPIFPALLLLLVTYWMREEIYQAWFRFARWWVPLSMLAILIAPEYSGDWLYPIEKGGVALVSSVIFCLVSVVIIGFKYSSLRRR